MSNSRKRTNYYVFCILSDGTTKAYKMDSLSQAIVQGISMANEEMEYLCNPSSVLPIGIKHMKEIEVVEIEWVDDNYTYMDPKHLYFNDVFSIKPSSKTIHDTEIANSNGGHKVIRYDLNCRTRKYAYDIAALQLADEVYLHISNGYPFLNVSDAIKQLVMDNWDN